MRLQHVNGKFQIHCFGRHEYTVLPDFLLKTWLELSRVELYRNDMRESKNYFEWAGSSSSRGLNYSKCMTEIQGKSILVRVSEEFEVIAASQLSV